MIQLIKPALFKASCTRFFDVQFELRACLRSQKKSLKYYISSMRVDVISELFILALRYGKTTVVRNFRRSVTKFLIY